MTLTVVLAVIGVVIGALITWLVTRHYYKESNEDLKGENQWLHKSIDDLKSENHRLRSVVDRIDSRAEAELLERRDPRFRAVQLIEGIYKAVRMEDYYLRLISRAELRHLRAGGKMKSLSGQTYMTPDWYTTKEEAIQMLALPPAVAVAAICLIPKDKVKSVSATRRAEPRFGRLGGGWQLYTTEEIPSSDLIIILVPPA
ncbi:MAG: hypothetical protein ACE5JL_08595 [Dehalococcoidia bacterium]